MMSLLLVALTLRPTASLWLWKSTHPGAASFLLVGFIVPRRQKVNTCWHLKNFLANAERDSTPLYVCGDFNFPDINWDFQVAPSSDNLPSMVCDIINDSFLTQMNKNY